MNFVLLVLVDQYIKVLIYVLKPLKKWGDYILHICAKYEKDFFEVYKELPKNINFHGFLDIHSNEFKDILKKCKYIIAPSCSEGQMTSLILEIGNGLIPVATKECGVDIPEKLIIEKFDSEYIKNKIREIVELDLEDEIIRFQEKIRKQNSIEGFERNFYENIKKIIEKSE